MIFRLRLFRIRMDLFQDLKRSNDGSWVLLEGQKHSQLNLLRLAQLHWMG